MIINGTHITKDRYEKLLLIKVDGVKLVYGSDHSSPISYSLNGTIDYKIIEQTIKGIPKYFYDNIELYSGIFENNKIHVFADIGSVKIYAKVLKYKSISINPV